MDVLSRRRPDWEVQVIEEIMSKLAEGSAPSAVQVSRLAGRAPSEIPTIQLALRALPAERRRAVLGVAVQLAEDDVQLDFSALFRAGLKDADAAVRTRAVEGLWEDEEFRTADALAVLLRNDPDAGVRTAAALGLARFAVLAEVGTLYAPAAARVRQALLAAASDPAETLDVQRRSLESLGAFSGDDVSTLIDRGYGNPSDAMRASAVYAMGRSADERWLATVLHEFDNEGAEMRFEAVRAAGSIGSPRAVVPLIAVLEDVDSEVRLAAIGALGEIGGDVARKALEQCVRGEDLAMRDAAAEALAELDLGDDPLSVRPFTSDSSPPL
jgi:HEAT repeat protein